MSFSLQSPSRHHLRSTTPLGCKISAVKTVNMLSPKKGLVRCNTFGELVSKKSQPKKSAKLSKHKPLSPNTPKTNLRKTGKADKSVKTVNQGKAKHSGKRSRNPNSVQHQDTTILQVNSAVKINESVLSSLSEGLHLLKHQYFLYGNTYIPIQNSAQRKFVDRIRMVQLEDKSTSDCFYQSEQDSAINNSKTLKVKYDRDMDKDKTFQKQRETEEGKRCHENQKLQINQGIGTQIEQTDCQVGTSAMVLLDKNSQTETKELYQQQVDKCFEQVLTDLQFLYLPEDKHFRQLSRAEKRHYQQLFETLAGKIAAYRSEDKITNQQVEVLMFQREAMQIGAINCFVTKGFPTHAKSVQSFISNLFAFIETHHYELLLSMLKKVYGRSLNDRVQQLNRTKNLPVVQQPIFSEKIFVDFSTQLFKNFEFADEMTSDSIHIHNRAIFDAVNDELQIYKPFYACGGVPFPWTLNAGLTSYQFTEESIQIVFFQVKEKIEEKLNHLCGMHLDFADDVESQDNEFYKAKMAFHERKAVTCEVAELDYTYEVEEEFARVLFNITDQIYLTLLIEAAADTGGYRLDRPQDIILNVDDDAQEENEFACYADFLKDTEDDRDALPMFIKEEGEQF